ncbi:hypothetical protein RJT34_18141 [Clitoria ternatea]|uniref:Uncharacterized protein n=1 Tax=Clitoria ternatea TaxID=43366 RepID=A0AAN9PEB6_CLITE
MINYIQKDFASALRVAVNFEGAMGSEDAKDPLKGVDWKAVGGEMQQNPSAQPTLKKRLPKRVRQIPDYYFLPQWPLHKAIFFCSACIAGGVAAGMVVESWIDKKVKEDGGIIWEFEK